MDQEEILDEVEMAGMQMDSSIDHLKHELAKISTGKASPAMVKELLVDYYGAPTPMAQVANISTSDARTLVIQPWEKSTLAGIERAIFEANLGVTPQNDGEVVRIIIPMLTEERRRELAKKAKSEGEHAKVGVRNARRAIMEKIKKAVKAGYPEDQGKRLEGDVDGMTKKHSESIDELVAAKEKDIMTV